MKTSKQQLFEVPNWITPEAWYGFEEMRKKQRKPLTDRARNCIVNTLWRLKEDQGQNADAVLDQSTVNCWLDVYPIREKRNGNGNSQGKLDRIAQRYLEGQR